jgi:hypothetical protein
MASYSWYRSSRRIMDQTPRRNFSPSPHGGTCQKTWVFSNTAVRALDVAGCVFAGRESRLGLMLLVAGLLWRKFGFCPWPVVVEYLAWVKGHCERGFPQEMPVPVALYLSLVIPRGLNRGLRGQRVVCNRLSHAAASSGREKQRSVRKLSEKMFFETNTWI